MSTKFQKAAPCRYEVIWIQVEIGRILTTGAIFWSISLFSFINIIYYSYEIYLRSFKRPHAAIAKLCEFRLKLAGHWLQVWFLINFFTFMNIIYYSYEICLQNFERPCATIVKLCEFWLKLAGYWLLVWFFAQFL